MCLYLEGCLAVKIVEMQLKIPPMWPFESTTIPIRKQTKIWPNLDAPVTQFQSAQFCKKQVLKE